MHIPGNTNFLSRKSEKFWKSTVDAHKLDKAEVSINQDIWILEYHIRFLRIIIILSEMERTNFKQKSNIIKILKKRSLASVYRQNAWTEKYT